MENFEVLNSEKTYTGKIVDVFVDTLKTPNGGKTYRETVIRGGASAVLPVDSEGNIIFVRQYRHPVRDCVLEIPAGMLDGDENPYVCAARELEEETGYKAETLTLLSPMRSAIGFCTEVIHIYFAECLTKGNQNFDHDEFIEIERYPLDTAVEMVFDGKIQDSKTIAAIFMYKEWKNRNK